MRKLNKLTTDPPGGWYYYCPEDDCLIEAGYYEKLIRRIKDHYAANDQEPPEDLDEQVQDQICRRIPGNFCNGIGPIAPTPDRKTFDEKTRKLIGMIRTNPDNRAQYGYDIDRIPVCVSCIYNNNRLGCFTCTGTYKHCRGAFPRLSGVHDGNLKACDLFEIFGIALCASSESLIREMFSSMDMTPVPDNCWIKKILTEEPDDGKS